MTTGDTLPPPASGTEALIGMLHADSPTAQLPPTDAAEASAGSPSGAATDAGGDTVKTVSLVNLVLGGAVIVLVVLAGMRFGPQLWSSWNTSSDSARLDVGVGAPDARSPSQNPSPSQKPAEVPTAQLGPGYGDMQADRPDGGYGPRPGTLGITVRNGFAVNEFGADVRGAVVTEVDPDGAAADAGLRRGDTVVALADVRVESTSSLGSTFQQVNQEKVTRMRIIRQNRTLELVVRLR